MQDPKACLTLVCHYMRQFHAISILPTSNLKQLCKNPFINKLTNIILNSYIYIYIYISILYIYIYYIQYFCTKNGIKNGVKCNRGPVPVVPLSFAPRTCLALGRKSLESLLGPGGSVLRRSAIKAMLMDNATWRETEPRNGTASGKWPKTIGKPQENDGFMTF